MGRALFAVPAGGLIVAVLVGASACLNTEAPVTSISDASASEAAVDVDAGSDAKANVPCDAGAPTTLSRSVACLADGGRCDTTTTECCENSVGFACAGAGSCDPNGYACDKASDCTSGICCITMLSPDTSTCPPSGKTSDGTRCTTATSCGIGQLELCAADQACTDTSKHCKLVNVSITSFGNFVIGERTVGVCF